MLAKDVEDMDDSITYSYLSKTKPNGKVKLNPREKKEFEEWLGINDK